MTGNAVATPHYLSAEAARHILLNGGNAVDAAIAAVAAQGVVAPETCGVGGDLFALVHSRGWDRPRALNSSGRAGSNADAQVLRATGNDVIPRDHPLTVTIPGCVDGLVALSSGLGALTLGEALDPAITLARQGFAVSTEQAGAFDRMASVYGKNPAVAEFYPDGASVKKGEVVTRDALGDTLEAVAGNGRDAFYLGTPGEDIVTAVGGLITLEDMADSQAEWIEPIGVDVAGLEAWTVPPNSQGYLGPATLAVFEMLGPPDDTGDPLWWHLLIEAYRCIAWERNDLVADPDHATLPTELILDRDRLERAAGTIDPGRAGVWPVGTGGASGTAYLCVADDEGTAVSIIQSNYRGTGSVFGAARSGFLLQDRGGGFSLMPGHPNELGPGRRPLHTLAPTLWTDDRGARWTLGSRGGAVQPQLIAQIGARAIIGDGRLDEAQEAPRWTVSEFGPLAEPALAVEPGVDPNVISGLETRGHAVRQLERLQPGWGPVSVIEMDGSTRRTAPDPRVDTTTVLVF